MFTGLAPRDTGVTRNGLRLPPNVPLLTELLAASGYRTAGFVSAAPLGRQTQFARGFETYDQPPAPERVCGATVARAIRWLKQNDETPFFLFVHLFDPHTAYRAPPEFREKMGAPRGIMPPFLEFVPSPSVFEEAQIEGSIRAHDADIAYTDWCFGHLLDALERSGLRESSAIILVSDHGESFDELLESHSYAFDHGEFLDAHQLQVPLLIHEQGQTEARVHEQPVSTQALMATALELVGDAPRDGIMRSLLGEMAVPDEDAMLLSQRRSFVEPPRPFLRGEAYSLIRRGWQYIRTGEQARLIPLDASSAMIPDEQKEPLESEFNAALDAILAAPPSQASERVEDESLHEQLRALGYAE